jgi:hypothetical protein
LVDGALETVGQFASLKGLAQNHDVRAGPLAHAPVAEGRNEDHRRGLKLVGEPLNSGICTSQMMQLVSRR